MKANRFREVRAAGQMPVGHMLSEFGSRGMARMLEAAGVDFVLIDTEHGQFSPGEVSNLVAWFAATPVAPFVRIPQPDYHFIARTLDGGGLGIMVPNVQDAATARAIVRAAKYAPEGERGVFMGGANTEYRKVEPVAFMAEANANTTVICQIESRAGVDNIEEIATTPGVDVLWVGHFDLTVSLGIPAEFHNPIFLDALKTVIAAAQKHNLGMGIQPANADQAHEWRDMGVNIISYSGDMAVYTDALANGVAAMRAL